MGHLIPAGTGYHTYRDVALTETSAPIMREPEAELGNDEANIASLFESGM